MLHALPYGCTGVHAPMHSRCAIHASRIGVSDRNRRIRRTLSGWHLDRAANSATLQPGFANPSTTNRSAFTSLLWEAKGMDLANQCWRTPGPMHWR